MGKETKIKCLRCENNISVLVNDLENEPQEVECDECGASLKLTYTIPVKVDSVDVIKVPPVEFECPECGCFMGIEGVEEESGSDRIECNGCDVLLEVTWSDWGQRIDVEVIETHEEEGYYEEEEEWL